MSTKQTQTKNKISDVAKDLKVSNQELAELVSEKFGSPRKPSASINQDELNYILEHYSQNNQVDSFEPYFALRNEKPAPKPVAEKPAAEKKPANKKNESKQPKSDATEKTANKEAAKVPAQVKETKKPEAPKASAPKTEAPKTEAPKTETQKSDKKPQQNVPVRKDTQKSAVEKFENQIKKSNEQKKNQAAKASEKKQEAKPAENKSTKTKLGGNFSTESVKVEQKVRTVDTRGSYVDIDKYNEKYENIAPVNGGGGGKHGKDNFSKKQKLTQKSAQRNKQQYSSKKETEAEKLRRLELERARKQQLKVLIPDEIVVSELASRLKVTATEVIKKLMGLGEMCTINQVIDFDTASLVAEELGAKVEKEVIITIEERLIDDSEDDGEGEERAPVVVVMGHVDHGKTSLLDRIRNANVTASEAGGITQHIGAYRVKCKGKEITFLDTPGHEAFTSMRARGASVTDIAILVVAADDGIMPQTVEAINHAKAAGVSIIVAINKMDKEGANPQNVMQQLTEHNLVVEEWGGDVICVPVSAKTGMGIDDLLENILLVAEVAELRANPNRLAKGTVIEARLDKGRGPIATVLVQNGTLRTGDIIIAGTSVGRVRVMTNDKGVVVHEAGPSYPVEITGLAEVPSAGDIFNAVEDERLARELVEQRKHEAKQEQFKQYQKVTLDNLFSQIEQGEIKELPIIVKADVQGSVEAVKQSLEKLSNDEVRIRVIHGAVGAVSEGDVMLASASNAIIVGFNVRPDPVAADNAERDGVDIRLYRIIYDAIEEITTAMKGMLAPKFREIAMGRIEVRQVYKISSVGLVAGSYVLSGKVTRASQIRVVRDGIVIAEDKMSSLKRFKDDVKEVAEGYECGITLEKFNDIKEGDIFEAFIIEEYRPD
ncbi:MAG: translation initiation factor IF-2 [Oscillospiraceae bacterium]|nr:translation initiation factor IF-2 [Oscillospiraceae bacterium]